ncbi:MAG TPA: arginine-tRNA-protein transferase [Saprospiraceae bacterium]|nr:arginine-tRNA-protein transferase [Saprospiraceae bacterium]HMQ81326.1 arginine-tRNA-protein transferase [Saprospiraceae bacterium]
MFAEKRYPEKLDADELDEYLSKGWYRMGQSIFTTHFLCFGHTFFSALWIRLPLDKHASSKRHRKLMRRNSRLEISYSPFNHQQPDKEQENLYQRYRKQFPGLLAPSLRDALYDGDEKNIFNTWQCIIKDGGKLVALSYFDLGQQSIASIMGIYDPAYKNDSLGFYTMLMEIEFGRSNGFQYYYPGYIVPGYPRFDYKMRIGKVESYLLRNDDWAPFPSQVKSEDVPMLKMDRHLQEMCHYLNLNHSPCVKKYYPLFEANLFGFWHAPYLDYPVLLVCSQLENPHTFLITVFDPRQEEYHLMRCSIFDDLQFYFNPTFTESFNPKDHFLELLIIDEMIEKSKKPQDILLALRYVTDSTR